MDYNHFFITLPSDASMVAHPDNQGGEFAVDLVEEMSLSPHQWEVALAEMIFNQDWNPMVPQDLWVTMCLNSDEKGGWVNCQAVHAPETILKERVDTVKALWDKILKPLIDEAGKLANVKVENFKLVQDKTTKQVTLSGKLTTEAKVVVRMEWSTSLVQMMGFTRQQLVDSRYFQTDASFNVKSVESHFAPSLKRGITSLWIYTDIITNQITGDTMSPLLRVIQVDPNLGNEVSRVVEFQRPHFCALQAGNIQTIRVAIRNSFGLVPIQFATPVICKLMFRRKSGKAL